MKYALVSQSNSSYKGREIYSKNVAGHSIALFVILATLLSACNGSTIATETPTPVDASVVTEAPVVSTAGPVVDPLADLESAAHAEGMLSVIALPRDWCSYGEIIDVFKAKYPGIEVNELNPEAGSGDQVDAIKANKDNASPQAPDVIDVGLAFGISAKAEALIKPYKVLTWDSIPADAKDVDGYWYGDYYGVLSFLVNTDVQPDVPKDWADLLDPKYKGQVALSGDPRITAEAIQSVASAQAVQSVIASALSNGGSLDNIQPGLEYFAKMNAVGNLVPIISNTGLVASGETPIRITWDYLALPAVDSFAGTPKADVVIPTTGRLAGEYVQAISAYAPHPNAAKLWMEFLYSDDGQMLLMKGYCHPIRETDMRERGVIPADLLAKMPDVSGAVFPSFSQLNAAEMFITTNWDAVVGANIQVSP
jgi:putative spermidine/putrescine transport system substrate-binding protein